MSKRALIVSIAVAAGLTLAACSAQNAGPNTPSTTADTVKTSETPTGSATSAGQHNQVDVMFVTMMIPHHQGAIEMADLALSKASSPDVKTLAAKIKAAQDPEIKQMQGWLADWGVTASMTGMPGMDHSGMGGATGSATTEDYGMGSMMNMSESDMAALEAATGTEFDKLFLTQMIAHHQGAIDMSNVVIAQGSDPQVRTLAQNIKTSQQAEITQMKDLLTTL